MRAFKTNAFLLDIKPSSDSEFALSEQTIISSPQLCGTSNSQSISQLRADFTNCALPANSLSGVCVPGYQNEPDNCGFQSNLEGLCTYCGSSSVNSTDSCCVTSQVESRCSNVHLPTYTSMQPLFPSSTSSSTPVATGGAQNPVASHKGLSGGEIAGIVIGSVLGAAVLLAILICCCVLLRRRRQRDEKSSLNQPTPPRTSSSKKPLTSLTGLAGIPGARVTRMTALEGSSGTSPHDGLDGVSGQQTPSRGRAADQKAPLTRDAATAALPKRDKSLSDGLDPSSPESNGYSPYDAAAGNQSEQLDAFKDYYSTEEVRPGDPVSTLWAYQPRAPDEFELERGDMLRIVGIWDDGWATGVRINDRAEDYEPGQSFPRDSGVSNSTRADDSPPTNGDVKAFPVSHPDSYQRSIDQTLTLSAAGLRVSPATLEENY
ncbi:MAG: hypothetical protein M1828_004649 [Chrysothrix sp. TS-e1954]|nr:MAG: hypothetical protein M1828_004649 [Chrysothrix sp. TS-e1954]